jgi:hypothetical protein
MASAQSPPLLNLCETLPSAPQSRLLATRLALPLCSTVAALLRTFDPSALLPVPPTDLNLLAQTQPRDQRKITLIVLALEVREVTTALTNQLQQTAARTFVILVDIQVFDQGVDARGQECDLDFGGSGIRITDSVLLNQIAFL